jgi:hypothetical protein
MVLMLTFFINTVDFSPLLKQSCLHMATTACNSDIVTILLQNRADDNCLDVKGITWCIKFKNAFARLANVVYAPNKK